MEKFRRAFVIQPTQHDYSGLKDIAEQITFISSGIEDFDKLEKVFEQAFKNFDPELDVVVPVGRVILCFIFGALFQKYIQKYFSSEQKLKLAIFEQGNYQIKEISINGTDEL